MRLLVRAALWSVNLAYHAWARSKLPSGADYRPLMSFFYFALALPHLAHPFGVLAAGLYVENGLPAHLFFITVLMMVRLLGRQQSWAAERSRQQSQALSDGNFFDILRLPEGKIGLAIADVVDKGIGAALYMTLGRTMLRTYAIEADSDPGLVFFATNSRMMADNASTLFVTAFYGVLNPHTGRLSYSNAGHHPPYAIRSSEKIIILELIRTRLPEGARWTKAAVQLEPGDRLIPYTDGVPDARNHRGEAFSIQPILEVAKQILGLSAEELQSKLSQEIAAFVGNAPQSDDFTLMVLARDPAS